VDDLQNALDHLNAMKDILIPLGLLDVDVMQAGGRILANTNAEYGN
jgi:hypothetical protein